MWTHGASTLGNVDIGGVSTGECGHRGCQHWGMWTHGASALGNVDTRGVNTGGYGYIRRQMDMDSQIKIPTYYRHLLALSLRNTGGVSQATRIRPRASVEAHRTERDGPRAGRPKLTPPTDAASYVTHGGRLQRTINDRSRRDDPSAQQGCGTETEAATREAREHRGCDHHSASTARPRTESRYGREPITAPQLDWTAASRSSRVTRRWCGYDETFKVIDTRTRGSGSTNN